MRPFTHFPSILFCLLPVFSSVAIVLSSPVTDPSNPLSSLLTFVEDHTNVSPPELVSTSNPSPQCAAINGGELQCCRAMVAGDLQLIVLLATEFGYKLNPNDINGLDCDNNLATCPGVKLCCQVTALSPLLSLYCQQD